MIKRPLLWGFAFAAAGVFLAKYFGAAAFAGAAAALGLSALVYARDRYKGALVLPVFYLLGVLVMVWGARSPSPALDTLAQSGAAVSVTGRIADVRATSGAQGIILQARSFNDGKRTYNVNVKIDLLMVNPENVAIGENVGVYGALRPLDVQRNPGGFDEKLYYNTRGVYYGMTSTALTPGPVSPGFIAFFGAIRTDLSNVYDNIMPPAQAALMRAILLGDITGLDDQTKQLYKLSGLYYIFVVSGLHVVMVSALMDYIVCFFFGRKASLAVTVCAVVFYCCLTGMSVPAVRATVMSCVLLTSRMLRKDSDSLVSISFCGICLLLYQPLFLWDIGFQYSFTAVFGLLLTAKAVRSVYNLAGEGRPTLNNALNSGFMNNVVTPSVAVTLSTTHIMLYCFYYVLPYAIIINAIIVPTVEFVFITGLLAGLVGLFSLSAGAFLASAPSFAFQAYDRILHAFSKLPAAVVYTGRPPFVILLLLIAAVCVFTYIFLQDRERLARRAKYAVLPFAALAAAVWVYSAVPKNAEITMLDLGRERCLVASDGKNAFVADCGGTSAASDVPGLSELDVFLNYKGITHVDGVFATCERTDYIGGLPDLLNSKKVDRLYLPDAYHAQTPDALQSLIDKADADGVQIIRLKNGDTVSAGAFGFECLYPITGQVKGAAPPLALRLRRGNASFLLTSDMNADMLNQLLYNKVDVRADVLLLTGGGAKPAFDTGFVGAVNPVAAAIYADTKPDAAYFHNFASSNIPLYTTSANGAVTMSVNGARIGVSTMLRAQP